MLVCCFVVDYSCNADQFLCDTRKCIPQSALCDAQFDCKDLSDETNCCNYF